jgi:NAD(P)-dependent dehydrogenase (short-subunit alcohol dehydrogenase family)
VNLFDIRKEKTSSRLNTKSETLVNGVAPAPIWDTAYFIDVSSKKVQRLSPHVTLGRPEQPEEIAPSYVFLASDDSSYMIWQILQPNGGTA